MLIKLQAFQKSLQQSCTPVELYSKNDDANNEIEAPKKDKYHHKKDNKLLMN